MKPKKNPENPQVLICGYSKSGTTIIAKTYAHCVGLELQNEIKPLWGISQLANTAIEPNGEVQHQIMAQGLWEKALSCVRQSPVLKFPEGILILNMFPEHTGLVCVIRHPLDTICAYLERKHEFRKLSFTLPELLEIAQDWNYHILSIKLSRKSCLLVSYEEFVAKPRKIISQMTEFLKIPLKAEIPPWVNQQVQMYTKYVPQGQPVRGEGRYILSIKDQSMIPVITNACSQALSFLESKGITYPDLEVREGS